MMFYQKQLPILLRDHRHQTVAEIFDRVVLVVCEFGEGIAQADNETLVIVKVVG